MSARCLSGWQLTRRRPSGNMERLAAVPSSHEPPALARWHFFELRRARPLPMRSSTRETGRAADRKEGILRAAIETFAQRGFFHARMAHIARAAGVGSGTLYLHFRSKDDLLVTIFDRVMGEAIAEGKEALAAIPDPVGRLDEIARLHLRRMGRDRQLAIVFQVELRQSVKFMEQFSSTRVREYLGIIREVIAAGQSGGVFRDGLKPT
ncbi:MAG: TetR/AcrR family transcriptional regulator, partial [Acidobacteria bacterium]